MRIGSAEPDSLDEIDELIIEGELESTSDVKLGLTGKDSEEEDSTEDVTEGLTGSDSEEDVIISAEELEESSTEDVKLGPTGILILSLGLELMLPLLVKDGPTGVLTNLLGTPELNDPLGIERLEKDGGSPELVSLLFAGPTGMLIGTLGADWEGLCDGNTTFELPKVGPTGVDDAGADPESENERGTEDGWPDCDGLEFPELIPEVYDDELVTGAGPHHGLLGFTDEEEAKDLVAVLVVTGRSRVQRDLVTYGS